MSRDLRSLAALAVLAALLTAVALVCSACDTTPTDSGSGPGVGASAGGGAGASAGTGAGASTGASASADASDEVAPEDQISSPGGWYGTYKGVIPMYNGTVQGDVPWEFTIDTDGNFKGGYQHRWNANLESHETFTGTVTKEGVVNATGIGGSSGTYNGKPFGGDRPSVLTGKIVDGKFTGTFSGPGTSQVMYPTATRQN